MPTLAVTLAYRERGLIVAPRNPLDLRSVTDLARDDVRLANRNPGSGTRVWLDARLRREGIDTSLVRGYDSAFSTHTAVATAIASGTADAGIGLRAAAESRDLAFQPLFQERYDLVMRRERIDDDAMTALIESLGSRRMRHSIGTLAGYDTSHTGEEAPVSA